MSQTYLGILTSLFGVYILPKLGVSIDDGTLQAFLQTAVILGGAIWAMIRRWQAGGINAIGVRNDS